MTCILVQTRSDGDMPVEGTIVNWGPQEPVLAAVLEYYQDMFLGYYPFDRPGRANPGNNNGGGGGGGGGGASGSGSGGGWKKVVMRDDYGGYYYMDESDEYQACDSSGNPIYAANRDGNPRGIVLVFVNSQNQTFYYSRDKTKACSLKKDSKTGRHHFIDDKGRKRNAQYVGKKPSWMGSKKQSSGHSRSSSSTYTPGPGSGSDLASKTTKPKVFTDKNSGKKYYLGADGRTHWL
jgi:hypothetical protein